MIGMHNIDKLYDFMRCKDWSAAHAMLDEIELADPNTHGIAHWRSVVLRDEGRYEDALDYLAENLHRFNCKTSVSHKRASIFYEMGNNAAALKELAKAPFDSEIDDYWALVMDAKFFYLYVMLEAGLPISSEQWAEIPDDYISLMPTGARVSKQQLADISQR